MKIIAIGGEPGSGKTTLMKKLIDKIEMKEYYDTVKLVPYLNKNNIYVIGKYEDIGYAQGTDRMSMACQPAVINWLTSLNKDSIVLYEGDRLFNSSFLEHCVDNYDLLIYYLKTLRETRLERYKDRNSNQNDTWLAGRETKISNILTNFNLMFHICSMHNNTLEEQQIIIDTIMREINV